MTSSALTLYRRQLAQTPAEAFDRANFANRLLDRGLIRDAATQLRRALASWPRAYLGHKWHAFLHSNLVVALSYDPALGDEALTEEYRRWERLHAIPLYRTRARHRNDPNPRRRLRVGYVSADFHDHAIAHLVEPLLAAHDRSEVEIACYAEVCRRDGMLEAIRGHADLWRETGPMSDLELAAQIEADGIDILVALAGHVGPNRLRAFALRPAPVQINLHNVSTSGMAAMDWWLTDPLLRSATEAAAEPPLIVPSLYLHRIPEDAPEPGPLPALRNGGITFGSFSNPAKLNSQVTGLWARILHAVPGSRLVLAYHGHFAEPETVALFTERFRQHGIEADRLTFQDAAPDRAAHLARVAEVDIALDPFPFNGGTSTFEALWMGVPVVTLAGTRFAGRGGVTHLTQAGLRDLIADDEAGYVEIAHRLAGSPEWVGTLRRILRERVRASPLCQAEPYARSIEAAYRQAWQAWCAQSASARPATMVVTASR